MVEINLDVHEISYTSGNYNVNPSKQEYKQDSEFEKIQYSITHKHQYTKSRLSGSSSSSYDLYIRLKKDRKHIFMFKANVGENFVNNVESYHSKKHINFPLVIGFKRDDMDQFRYYSFIYLKRESYNSGLPKGENYGPADLERILKDENNRVNKFKYSSKGLKSHISSRKDEGKYDQFIKLEYFPDNNNRYETNVLTKETLFSHERKNKINDSFVRLSYLDYVNIYYHKHSLLTVFVEFMDHSGRKSQYLRKDVDGYYWVDHTITTTRYDLFSQQLQIFHEQIRKNISYMLENNVGLYNDNITVKTQSYAFKEYNTYTHTTNNIGSFNNTFVIYGGRAINLVVSNITRGEKITSTELQSSKFTEIKTYSQGSKTKEHLLIKLTKDDKTHYYLKRFNRDGSKWRQLSIKELNDVRITKENEIDDQVFGQRLNQLLADRHNIRLFFDWIRLEIEDSLIILLDKKANESYTYDDISFAVLNIQPTKEINTVKLNNKKITVYDKPSSDEHCVNTYSYKVLVHDVKDMAKSNYESLVFRFLIPTDCSSKRFSEVTLYKMVEQNSLEVDYKHYDKVNNNVCVYFYGEDPRPLLLCYKNEVYRPNGESHYFDQWVKVDGLKLDKFSCLQGTEGAANAQLEKLLKALTETVGFLNPVNLWRHPGESRGTDGQTPCPALVSDPGGTTQCEAGTNGATTCKYTVHSYNGQNVHVQVDYEPVTDNGKTFYRKITHRPIGTGSNDGTNSNTGFRLGDIVYCANGKRVRINYYPKSQEGLGSRGTHLNTTHRWSPLVKVTTYFYNEDKTYSDPLLVVLEFKNGVSNWEKENREYYKLTSSGSTMEWKKETENPKKAEESRDLKKAEETRDPEKADESEEYTKADQAPNGEKASNAEEGQKPKEAPNVQGDGSKARGDPNMVTYLDNVRYNVKKVGQIEIHLHNKKTYKLTTNPSSMISNTNEFSPLHGATDDQITVEKLTNCELLAGAGFECLQHKLSSISDKTQYHIGGLKLIIPQNLPEQSTASSSIPYQEISLYNIKNHNEETVKDKVSNGTSYDKIRLHLDQYTPIYYDISMGELYVYFYVGNKTDESTSGDPRPGLVCLNKKAYRPLQLPKFNGGHYPYTGNDYTKWVRETNIDKCGCGNDEQEKIIKLLTEIYFGSSFMKFLQEHLIELSGGAGGLVGLISIITVGTLVFKKVTAASTAATAASTKISL